MAVGELFRLVEMHNEEKTGEKKIKGRLTRGRK